MNVLFLVGGWSVGGVERVTAVLSGEFARRGHGVTIVAHKFEDRALLTGMDPRVAAIELAERDRVSALRQILVDRKVDVIINQWCVPYKITCLINKSRRGLGVRLIAVHHNPPDKNQRILRARNPILRWATYAVTALNARLVYERSDAVIVLSDGFKKPFCRFIGRSSCPKLFAIPNPLTLAPPTRIDLQAKTNTVLYVGRLEETQKRVSRVIEAWREVADMLSDWDLCIVGDGPDRAAYEKMASGVPRIQFVGAKSPAAHYGKSKLLLLTSDYEGFGLVIVEAMASGVVPIVYGSYPAVYDIIQENVDGCILPMPYSRTDMVSTMRMLAEDPRQLMKMAEGARHKAKDFGLDAVAMKWEKLLGSI